MKIILLADSLQFLSLGTGKIHVIDYGYTVMRGRSRVTMCGRDVVTGAETRPVREMSSANVCGRCVASLRTYEGRWGTVAKVMFEREEVTS